LRAADSIRVSSGGTAPAERIAAATIAHTIHVPREELRDIGGEHARRCTATIWVQQRARACSAAISRCSSFVHAPLPRLRSGDRETSGESQAEKVQKARWRLVASREFVGRDMDRSENRQSHRKWGPRRLTGLEETSESGAKAEGAAATQKTDRDH